jgi:hypothetical protein
MGRVIVLMRSPLKIIGLSDVDLSVGIPQNVDPEIHQERMAPAVGFEPTTNRLTADRSTTELRWILRKARRLSGV